MTAGMTREAALELLQEYNQEPFHIVHALTVEGVMRWFAGELGYGSDADFWAMAGLEPSATTPKCLNISVALERREDRLELGAS